MKKILTVVLSAVLLLTACGNAAYAAAEETETAQTQTPEAVETSDATPAAEPSGGGALSPMFQAGALIELSGDTETAFSIYYETYDIHELPPLQEK